MSRARAIIEAEPRDILSRAAEREKKQLGVWPVEPGDHGYLFIIGDNPSVTLNIYGKTKALATARCNEVLKLLFPTGTKFFNDRWDTTLHVDWVVRPATEEDIQDEWDLDSERAR